MADVLSKIVAAKVQEVAERKDRVPLAALGRLADDAPPPRDFHASLARGPDIAFIAEVKKASPSAGVLREDFDPVAIAGIYERNGAAAISVLTDEPFFQGKLDYLRAIRRGAGVPLLRKDFLIDPYQVLEARAAGADAVLLIAEILDDRMLASLLGQTRSLGMEALVELYEADNLRRVVDAGARVIGVNNRNLRTFVTRLEHTLDLLPRMPAGVCAVSESGIKTRGDVERLQAAGVRAALIGETFMRAPDIGAKLRELRGDT